MSLKPPKKSDLGKSWMKNRRDKARMIQPEYHLIASEGTETEPQYFGAIQRIINSKYRDRIQLKVEGIGDNTVNLLMKARQYVQNNGIVFKHVWIVYDTDDFPAENIDMVAQLCEEYSAQGETIYHAVWSNQCVELWYLLHFMYMDDVLSVGQDVIGDCPGKHRVTLEYGQAVPYALADTAFLGGFQSCLYFLNALGRLHGVHGVF